ncbi:MAG: PKD domain-containing protein [Bacteroidetes bacterium]|nr:PKD domain-containing protein [Bacteroidota bacterium]
MKKSILISTIFVALHSIQSSAQIDFTATPTSGCAPLTVTFTNTTTDTIAYRYEWWFDDGSPVFVDTQTTSVQHTYNTSGNYYPNINVFDSLGNYIGWTMGSSGNISVLGSDYINIQPDSACPGEPLGFCGAWPGISWNWNFGDGNTDVNPCPEHSYSSAGDYTVTLIQTTSCGTDTVTDIAYVRTTIGSDADFGFNPSLSCPNDQINFYPYSGGGNHYWNFGDGNTSTLENLSHAFADTGTFQVMHIRQNTCGNTDTVIKTVTIDTTILIPSWVYLDIYNNPLCPDDRASFNTSYGFNSYQWNFGDGSPVLDTSASYMEHYYSDTGNYIVSVTFANGCGNDTTLRDTINIIDNLGFENFPWLSIDANMSTVCPGDNVNFWTDWGFAQYIWNFGDGSPLYNSGTDTYVNHTFSAYGNFNVSVTITNNCGIDTTMSIGVSVVNNAPVIGNFNLNINTSPACPNQTISVSTNYGYKQYSWNFGDGSPVITGKYASIEHNYSDTGNYNVTVTIFNNCGSDTAISDIVVISNNVGFPNDPWFSINVDNSPSCPDANIFFNAPFGYANYLWDFGDSTPTIGAPLNQLNHKYDTAGNYTVSVVITNHCGIDTTLSASVIISDSTWFGNFGSNVNPNTACPGQTISMGTQYGFYRYKWNFGDGTPVDSTTNTAWINHIYSIAGTFTFSVTITSYCGIDTVVTGTVTIDSTITIPSYSDIDINYTPACPGQEISFSADGGNKSYLWNFGDGSPQYASDYGWAEHAYLNVGVYPVSLFITNYCGFDTTLLDTVKILNNVGFPGNLSTYVWPVPVCPNDEVNMDVSSGYASYYWDFDDSTSAAGSSWANHAYDSAGIYYPTVTITNHCGIDTTLTFTVTVDANTQVPANLTLSSSVPMTCPGDQVRFDINGSNFALYVWTFGDGDTSITFSDEVFHTYDTAGVYSVSVTVFNGCGNYQTFYSGIIVDGNAPVPPGLDIFIPVTEACPGDEIQFIASNGSASYSYIWNFGDGTIDTSDAGNSHIYSDTGEFTISLTATNGCGNSYTTTGQISISDSIVPVMGNDSWGTPDDNQGGCPGDAILFYFWGTGQNLWDFGDGWTDVATEPLVVEDGFVITIIKHAYADTGSYKVKLTLTNACGFSTTDSFNLVVANNLLVSGDFLVEEPVNQGGYTTCQPIKFLAIGGETYSWNFGDGDTLTTINTTTTHIYSTPGTYSVSVLITNGCGNSTTMTTLVTVYEVGSATVNVNLISPVTCNNGNNGSAEATVIGGEPPFNYLWSDNAAQTNSTATGLESGTYFVTVTDNFGCMGTGSYTMANPAPMALNDSVISSSCGSGDGAIFIAVSSGGTPPFSYLWSTNDSTQLAEGLTSGVYYVLVTDSNGCSAFSEVAVNDSGAPVITVDGTNIVSCYGGINGGISVTASGGISPFTYLWSNGSTLEDQTSLAAGTYLLTVADAAGCNGIAVASVAQPAIISLSFSTVGTGCGTSNGTATVLPGGGTGAFTYLWDNNTNDQTTQTATGLPYGTFDITVTDANGCTSVGTASVDNTNAPAILSTITNVGCYGGSTGSIIQTVTGGTTPYTYSWNVGGATKNKNNIPAGTYICFISDASGCVSIRSYTVTQPAQLTATASSLTSATCGNSDGAVSATAAGGTSPYTYAWTGGGTGGMVTGLVAGNYTVTVTDNKGCTKTSTSTINTVAVEQPICVVTVDSATKKNLIAWPKTPGLSTSRYYIFKEILTNVYDTIGFVPYDSISYFIDYASNPMSKSERYKIATLDSCGNFSMLSDSHRTMLLQVNLGAQDQRNLSWQNYEGFTAPQYNIWRGTTSSNIVLIDSVVSTNTAYNDWDTLGGADSLFYIIEIVHPTGCTSTLKLKTYNSSKSNTASMEAPSLGITLTMSATDVTCNSGTNGTATATESGGTGPYSYMWNDPGAQSTQTATGLAASTYIVTVTDSKATTATDTVTVTEPPAISISVLSTPDTCGSGDGTATATATGGTGGFTYSWSSGQSNSISTGLAAATFTVTATDNSGCPSQNSIVVNTLNISLTVNTTVTDATCNNSDGTATATGGGGSGGYNYVWNNSQSAATATGLAPATYTVTATDGNGCMGNYSVTVNSVNVPLNLLTTSTNLNCYGGTNGTATVLPASGTSPYTYQWDANTGNQTNATATGLSANTFNVTVTDSKGCFGTQTVTVTQPAQITLSVSTVNSTCGNGDGSATVTAGGGVGGFTYSWNNGQTASTATSLSAGNYTVTVADGNNCQQTAVASVSSVNTPLNIITTSTNLNCFGGADGTATALPASGTSPYTYQWNAAAGNQTNATATGLSANTFEVTVTDSEGCFGTQTVTVTQPAQITLSVSTVNSTCGTADGSATVTAGGGGGGFIYSWSNGQTASTATGIGAGTYTVTVTDGNNCTQSTTASVSDANAPILSMSATPVTCNGDGDGTAMVNATGGTPPYTFLWDAAAGNQTDSTATGLSGGTYSVSVYDGTGCLAIQSASVTEPALLALIATVTDANSPGNNDGAIDITVTGGTGAYTYLWSNSETTEDISGLSAATYTVTVTDANNCVVVYSDTVKLITGLRYNPQPFELKIFPNPFKNETNIQYDLSAPSNVSVEIYSLIGEKVVSIIDEVQSAGVYTYSFNTKEAGIPTGIYVARFNVDGMTRNLRIIGLE